MARYNLVVNVLFSENSMRSLLIERRQSKIKNFKDIFKSFYMMDILDIVYLLCLDSWHLPFFIICIWLGLCWTVPFSHLSICHGLSSHFPRISFTHSGSIIHSKQGICYWPLWVAFPVVVKGRCLN